MLKRVTGKRKDPIDATFEVGVRRRRRAPDHGNDLRLDVPLRVFFHLRNPYDALATKTRKRNLPLSTAIDQFIELDRQITAAYEKLSDEEKLVQRHEDIIANPESHFVTMFEFLGVEPIQEVISGCAAKIWSKPNKTRDKT